MASRHRVRAPCMQIIKTATVPAAACKRVNIKQFHDSKIRFPLMRRMARWAAPLASPRDGILGCSGFGKGHSNGLLADIRTARPVLLACRRALRRRHRVFACLPDGSSRVCKREGGGVGIPHAAESLLCGPRAGRRRGRTRPSSRPCARTWRCTERRLPAARAPPRRRSGCGCCCTRTVGGARSSGAVLVVRRLPGRAPAGGILPVAGAGQGWRVLFWGCQAGSEQGLVGVLSLGKQRSARSLGGV